MGLSPSPTGSDAVSRQFRTELIVGHHAGVEDCLVGEEPPTAGVQSVASVVVVTVKEEDRRTGFFLLNMVKEPLEY